MQSNEHVYSAWTHANGWKKKLFEHFWNVSSLAKRVGALGIEFNASLLPF